MDFEAFCPMWCAPVVAFWLAPVALAVYCGVWGGCSKLASQLRHGHESH